MADNEPIVQEIQIKVDGDDNQQVDRLKQSIDALAESLVKSNAESAKTLDVSKAIDDVVQKTGASYEQAAAAIKKASDALGGVQKPPPLIDDAAVATIESYGAKLLAVGAAVGALVTVFGTAAKFAFNFAESQSKVINALGDLSDKTNTSIKDVSALQTAFAQSGASAGEFAAGYSKLTDTIQKSWDQIKKDNSAGFDLIEQRSLAAEQAAERLRKIEDQGKSPQQSDFVTKEIQQQQELRQARLAAREAERAENEARKNDIGQITRGVQSLIDGNAGSLKSFNATADNIVKGVVAAAGQGAAALNGLGDSFATVGSKAPGVKDVLENLGAALKNIEDPALRTKVAVAALGPAGQTFLNALDDGKLAQFTSGLDRLNNILNETDKKIASDFKSAISGFNQDMENIRSKLATPFEAGFIDSIKSLDEFFVRISPNIRAVGELISSILTPAVKTAVTALVTIGEAGNVAIDVFKNIASAISSIRSLNFDGLKNSLSNLGDIAKGIYEILKGIATLDFKQVEKGLQDLQEARKRNQDAKDAADEASNKKQAKTPVTIEEQILREADARDAAQKRQIEAELRAADARDAAAGIKPRATPQTSAPTAITAPEDPDTIANRLLDSFKRTFTGDFSNLEAKLKPVGDIIGNILRDGTVTKAEPTAPLTRSIGGQQQPVEDKGIFDRILERLELFGTKPPDKLGPEDISGIGIRGDAAQEATTKVASLGDSAGQAVDPLQSLKSAAANAAQALNQVSTGGGGGTFEEAGGGVAVADGGWIRGAGTETSDSIPAWLSHNEYVQPAAAVRHYGVGFMESIRKLQWPRFARGGLAQGGSGSNEVDQALKQAIQSLVSASSGKGDSVTAIQIAQIAAQAQVDSAAIQAQADEKLSTAISQLASDLKAAIEHLESAIMKAIEGNKGNNSQQDQQQGGANNRISNLDGSGQISQFQPTTNTPLPAFAGGPASTPAGIVIGNGTAQNPIQLSPAVNQQIFQPDPALGPDWFKGRLGPPPDQENIPGGATTNDSRRSSLDDTIDSLQQSFQQFTSTMQDAGSSAGSLGGSFQDLTQSSSDASAELDKIDVNDPQRPVGAADGGWIRGAGTETSDSIPAWLSHNEYVQPARAVRHYGVNFMESIRNLRLPRFSVGGLASFFPMPRFADGGSVVATSGAMPHLGTVTLDFGHSTVNVAVDRNNLKALRKATVQRRAGVDNKPSWVK